MATKKIGKKTNFPRVVVIGTSAGGLNALQKLISQLQPGFPFPVLVVQHISEDATGNVLLSALQKFGNLKCEHAKHRDKLAPGHLYLAPSGHHLMVGRGLEVLVTKGAHENRSRPAIDPLFRSAAVAFGSGTIGILLTGYLDDGTAGLKAIKRCGGVAIVQDPADAEYPDMPTNALNQVDVDYCLPLSAMGSLLYQLINKKRPGTKNIPKDVIIEANIAERVLSDLPSVNALGEQVPFNCPGCGGVLWKVDEGAALRFRCHTGHAYTASALVAEQTKKIEETLWVSLRMFEERKNLLLTMANKKNSINAKSARQRAEQSQVHIDRIRQMLHTDDKETKNDLPG